MWRITIESVGRTGIIHKYETYTKTMLEAQRVINTFKLKRGYVLNRVTIQNGGWLV